MTKVSILKRNGHIFEIECDGHTNYGESGEDIVCASLSSIVQNTALGLLQVLGIAINMIRDEKKGYLKISIPDGLDNNLQEKCDVLTNTLLLGISDLNEGFSDFIELEVKGK